MGRELLGPSMTSTPPRIRSWSRNWKYFTLRVKILHLEYFRMLILFRHICQMFFTLHVFWSKFEVCKCIKLLRGGLANICISLQLPNITSSIYEIVEKYFDIRWGTFWGSSQCTTTWLTRESPTKTSTSRMKSQRSSSLLRWFLKTILENVE